MGLTASEVVIWSADVDEARLRAELRAGQELRLIKLDRAGLTVMGLDAISWVQALGFRVFADAKIVEIADKSLVVAKLHLEHRPWMLNCMAGIVSTGDMTAENRKKLDGLKRFADACIEVGTLPCAVTVLTNKTPAIVAAEFNGRTAPEQVLWYVEFLLAAGFTDIVCSTDDLPIIRGESRFDHMKVNVPGIRLPGTDARDQARIGTPIGAMRAGATRLVIGSNLTDGDLDENFALIAANLEPFLAAA